MRTKRGMMPVLRQLAELTSISQGLAMSGRGAGARAGDWRLAIIEAANIEDDRVQPSDLRTVGIEHNARTEKHLLRPYDVLVTARSHAPKVALVPPQVTRTVAASTVLLVRAHRPETGMAHYLWYYLTSRQGRAEVERRIKTGASIPSLSAAALGSVAVPLPSPRDLERIIELVDASEEAYQAGLKAARLRREAVRDSLIAAIKAGKA